MEIRFIIFSSVSDKLLIVSSLEKSFDSGIVVGPISLLLYGVCYKHYPN